MADEFSAKADEIDPNLGSSAGAGTEDRGEGRGKDRIASTQRPVSEWVPSGRTLSL
jgi:hypothetical protein